MPVPASEHGREQLRGPIDVDAFRLAFDDAAVGVAIGTGDGPLVYVNAAMCRILGRSADELDGEAFLAATHPADCLVVRGHFRSLAAGEIDTYVSETRFLHPDRSVVHARVHVAASRDARGKLTYLVCHAEDLTEQRRTEGELRETEARFRAASEASLDSLMIFDAVRDDEGRVVDFLIVDANDNAERLFGRPRARLVGRRIVEAYPEVVTTGAFARYREVLETEAPSVREFPVDDPNVAAHWLREQIVPIADGIAITASNISERKAIELALRATEARLTGLLRHSSDVVLVIGRHARTVYASPAVTEVLGYAPDEFLGFDLLSLVHPDDHTGWLEQWQAVNHQPGTRITVEVRARRADGVYRWCEVTLRDLNRDPAIDGYVVHFHDVTDRREAQHDLAQRALHDDLTGLGNRALFLDRLALALHRSERTTDHAVVLFCDLDHFKAVNDTLGHSVGDALLREVGARLRNALRPGDTVARIGGDEFAVCCEDVLDHAEAAKLGERILDAFREPFTVLGRELRLTTSIGIALSDTASTSPESLLRDADAAMYVAKGKGRSRAERFDERARNQVQRRLDIEDGLRLAVVEERLDLRWQPIFSLATGRVVGVEALVRWPHPEQGLLGPDEFLHVATETGLDAEIGGWVLTTAAAQAAAWRDLALVDPGTVWVNVTENQLRRRSLLGDVATLMAEHSLGTGSLGFELTEPILAEADSTPAIATNLAGLSGLGCRIALDDYGTGYSSLPAIRRHRVGVLKLHPGLFGRGSDGTVGMIELIVAVGHRMGLEISAEGVETAEQLALCSRAGCSSAAGYHLAAPTRADALIELLPTAAPTR